jgi:hypothetical protein
MIARLLSSIPYASEQRIFEKEQGISEGDQGIFGEASSRSSRRGARPVQPHSLVRRGGRAFASQAAVP